MLFINPMWRNEAERIGKQRCTPLGYALHGISDILGLVALLLLFGIVSYLAYRRLVGGFHASLLWFFSIPFGIAVIGSILFRISWTLAYRRGFRYDHKSGEATWLEHGKRRNYKCDHPT
jgi:hypothetical protein